MNQKYKIIWSPDFYKELTNICNYISYTLNEYIVANKLYSEIINSIAILEKFPLIYPIIKKLPKQKSTLRKIIKKSFVMIYKVNEETRRDFYITYISLQSKLFKFTMRLIIKYKFYFCII